MRSQPAPGPQPAGVPGAVGAPRLSLAKGLEEAKRAKRDGKAIAFHHCLRAPETIRISTMAKTRMVSGALKQWRWEEHPEGANFPSEVNFALRKRIFRGTEGLK